MAALHSERHIDTDRAGGGNYATLYDFLNGSEVMPLPFSEVDLTASSAQYVLIDDSVNAGNLAIGLGTAELDGGIMAVALAGGVGTASTANVTDDNGHVLNLVQLRDAGTNDPIIEATGHVVYGLMQCPSTATDGDAIGASGSENCQVSFIYIADDGTITLVALDQAVEVALNVVYSQRFLPTIRKAGAVPAREVIAASAVPSEPKCRKFNVTSAFAAAEVITVATGAGALSGAATPSGDTITSIGATSSVFEDDNRIRARVNGAQCTKAVEAIWDSATTFHFSVALDPGDSFEVETAE